MTQTFKPMLSGKVDFNKLQFPVLVSPKLDGIRCLVRGGVPVSRNLKPIPNLHTRKILTDWSLEGFDGELIVGPAYDKNVYQTTNSGVMSKDGEPDFMFHVFDILPDYDLEPYSSRVSRLIDAVTQLPPSVRRHIVVLPQVQCNTEPELLELEANMLEIGYEGVMVRSPNGLYKNGRSTVNEGHLLKLKRFEDSEARIVGLECMFHNANEAKTDALGHTERSSHKENMVPLDTLGKLVVQDIKTGVEFSIGTGFTAAQRDELWRTQDDILGKVVKYKHFAVGVVDKPRFPVFLGFRSEQDMGE